jgi:Dyp-type peroxidase family
VAIEWADIQGNILRGYVFTRARYAFIEIVDAEKAYGWLAETIAPRVEAPPLGWRQPAGSALNIGFSYAGLQALETDQAALAAFPPEFRDGMWRRASSLGDQAWQSDWYQQAKEVGPGRRELLRPPPTEVRPWQRTAGISGDPSTAPTQRAHVLISVYGDDDGVLDNCLDQLQIPQSPPGGNLAGLTHVEVLTPNGRDEGDPPAEASNEPVRPRYRREHFGFADGISQPRILGVDPGGSHRRLLHRWRAEPNPAIEPGEFVLGYPDGDNPRPVLPSPPELFRNGSYLVYRKLEQDVPTFRAFIQTAGGQGGSTANLAAAVMGRQYDGTPLVGPIDAGDPDTDFSYRHDPDGVECPLGAHVRRANPRDGNPFAESSINRHRLLRRGMPYGPEYTDQTGTEQPDYERGLIFLAYCASLSRQFEFVQKLWLNDGNALGIGHDPDLIAGVRSGPASMAAQRVKEGLVSSTEPFVNPQGGEYYFVPGLTALGQLALGRFRSR